VRLLILFITAALVFASMTCLPPILGENDASRWSTAWSLSTGRGYIIDESPYSTCDKVFRDGHYYSSKPALMPTVLAGLVRVTTLNNTLSFRWYEKIHVRLILLVINLLPLLILIVLYDRLLAEWKLSAPARMFCLLAAALGTYITGYSVTLNNHTQAAWATFFSLYCLIRILQAPEGRGLLFSACAFFACWAAINENPAIAYLLIISVILLIYYPRQSLVFFLPVLLLMLGAFFLTTYFATGRLYPYSLNYDKDLYTYPGTVWLNPTGIDAQHEPKWLYAMNLTIGHHGLLSLTPVFFFSLWGLRKNYSFDIAHQVINRIGLALIVSITLLYIICTHNYGGGCMGPRWLIWMMPFLLLSLPAVIQRHYHSKTFRALAYAALFISIYSIGYALAKGPWGRNNDSWLQWLFRFFQWIPY